MQQARSSGKLPAAGVLLACIVCSVPVLMVAVPPLLDYPNHLARLWLIADGDRIPEVAAIYRVNWSVSWTNILIDLIASIVSPFAGIAVIGGLVTLMGLLLAPIGAALVNRSLFGGFHWWNIFCFVLCWNWIYLAGFLNFEIGLGLGLVFAAADHRLAGRPMAIIVFARLVFATLLLITHPFALLFFGFLLGGMAIGPRLAIYREKSALSGLVKRFIGVGLPLAIPIVVMVLFGPKLPGSTQLAHTPAIMWHEYTPKALASVLLTYFKTYDLRWDAVFLAAFVALPVYAAIRGRLQVHAGLLLTAALLGVVSLFVPRVAMATAFIDTRLPAMMALMLAASLRPGLGLAGVPRLAFVGMAIAFVTLRTGYVSFVWNGADADMNATRAALSVVPAGSAVLPLHNAQSEGARRDARPGRMLAQSTPVYWQYASFAVMDRHAFIPMLFSAPGKQPIEVVGAWKDIAVPEGNLASADQLANPDDPEFSYLKLWKTRFDYVLLLNADAANDKGPLDTSLSLQLVSDRGFAKVYKINR